MWPTRHSRLRGAFIDVRTMPASIDATYDNDYDSSSSIIVGLDFHAERSAGTSADRATMTARREGEGAILQARAGRAARWQQQQNAASAAADAAPPPREEEGEEPLRDSRVKAAASDGFVNIGVDVGAGCDGYEAEATCWGAGSGSAATAVENVLTRREESPSSPAPGGASPTGRTYDDFTKTPPPHLRCVVSPLSSFLSTTCPPVHRRVTTIFVGDVPGLRRVQAVLFAVLSLGCLVIDV